MENYKKLEKVIEIIDLRSQDSLHAIYSLSDQKVEMIFHNARKMHKIQETLKGVITEVQIIKREEFARATQDQEDG